MACLRQLLYVVLFYRPWIPKIQVSNTQNFFKHNPPPVGSTFGMETSFQITYTHETGKIRATRKTILKIIYDDAFKGRKILFIARGTVVIGETHREQPKPVKLGEKSGFGKHSATPTFHSQEKSPKGMF